MFKIKKSRKESTDPAQLVDSVEQAARQAKENMRWLVAGVAVAVLAGVAVGGFLWMRQQEDRAAAELFYEATRHASEPSLTGGPPPMRRPEEVQKAIETFRKILTDFPSSSVAPQAAYLLGNALNERKDWDGAIKAYQDFLARYGANRLLVPLVYQRMAYAQLAQGKLDEAEKTFTAIVQMPSAPNKDHALYELGKINELLNRPEGALAYYQQIVKDHPSSPFATEASVRIKTLDARKAVAPAAEPPAPPPPSPQK
jgi:tetratricopeptide (TPR) repeat protein